MYLYVSFENLIDMILLEVFQTIVVIREIYKFMNYLSLIEILLQCRHG